MNGNLNTNSISFNESSRALTTQVSKMLYGLTAHEQIVLLFSSGQVTGEINKENFIKVGPAQVCPSSLIKIKKKPNRKIQLGDHTWPNNACIKSRN